MTLNRPGLTIVFGSLLILSSTPQIGDRSIVEARRGPDVIKAQAPPTAADRARWREATGKLPMSFEPNQGQTDPSVKFVSRGPGYGLFLTSTEAVLTISKTAAKDAEPSASAALRMRLIGANPAAEVTGDDELPGKTNYFIGNDPNQWRTNIPMYGKVRYRNVYSGIDLVYYGQGRQLEYDFVVAPGAHPNRILFGFEGTRQVSIDESGNLALETDGCGIRLLKPVVYQQVAGKKQKVAGECVLLNTEEVGFRVGNYDVREPLVIDPVLSYSTYLGGSNADYGYGIAVDASGNAYVTGYTYSTNFPTANPLQPGLAGAGWSDVVVSKLNAAGSGLLYSTYLGGSGGDGGYGIAVDASGNAYIAGYTESTNFPTANPLQPGLAGTQDAFVVKLNAAGSALLYSTYLGGSNFDYGYGIAVDASGNAYITGYTESTNFPTADPLQPGFAGGLADAFVSKLNAAGSTLLYSTYLGGIDQDEGYGIAVDASGNAYVTGFTESTNFPTANPFQSALAGFSNAFVSKLNAAGSALLYSTYLGGSDYDGGYGITVDASGNAYVTGFTRFTDFPTANPLQAAFAGLSDAFVSKLNPAGSALLYSTYLGGSNYDGGYGIAVDASGNAYVTGFTESTNFPTANPLQPAFASGGADAFIAKIASSSSTPPKKRRGQVTSN